MRTVMVDLIKINSRNLEGKPHSWTTYDKTYTPLQPGEKVVTSYIVTHNDSVYIVFVIKQCITFGWLIWFIPVLLMIIFVYLKYKHHI